MATKFSTKKSAVGELLYRLKFKSDKTALDEIINSAADFLENRWRIVKDIVAIIPVPPSKKRTGFQPLIEVAKGISSGLNIPFYDDVVVKVKNASVERHLRI